MKKLFVILMMLCLLRVSVYADEIDDIKDLTNNYICDIVVSSGR